MRNRFWLAVVLAVAALILWGSAFLILARTANAQVSGPKPQRGEWLCWATNARGRCGTYGWHVRRSVALMAAIDLCERRCGTRCAEDYCEVMK